MQGCSRHSASDFVHCGGAVLFPLLCGPSPSSVSQIQFQGSVHGSSSSQLILFRISRSSRHRTHRHWSGRNWARNHWLAEHRASGRNWSCFVFARNSRWPASPGYIRAHLSNGLSSGEGGICALGVATQSLEKEEGRVVRVLLQETSVSGLSAFS